jgi:low temperature requirement protein LtrA
MEPSDLPAQLGEQAIDLVVVAPMGHRPRPHPAFHNGGVGTFISYASDSVATTELRTRSPSEARSGERVTSLELFFDLVFVFGFTQVTTVLSDDPTWSGLGHGLLILAALWWAWAAYAWLTNTADPDEGGVWGAMLVAMAAMFVAALAVPETFGRHGVVFGVAFLIVNVMHLALYALTARDDKDLLTAILRTAPTSLTGAALIIAAGFAHGGLRPARWLAALVVGLFGPLLTGIGGWRVQTAHFVERHGLIVIIAIGESLIAIGLGARSAGLGTGVIVGAVLGLVVAASFWLAYFDFFPIRGERLLADRSGAERTALARDVYTYLHLPMVAGIVLFAFALKATLAHVGDELNTVPAFCLCGGPALYLFAYVALRLRVAHTLGGGRLVATVACASLFPVATAVPALVALTLVTVVWLGLHAYEFIWWREARAQTRASRLPASAS